MENHNHHHHASKHYRKYSLIGILIGFWLVSFQIGAQETFTVTHRGKGQAIIFIPGLMSDGSVWADTAKLFAEQNHVHLISIAGFAGKDPIAGLSLQQVTTDIAKYIEDNNLESPVIIGHSLGGFIALKLAIEYPEHVSKILSVDGLPFLAPIFTRSPTTTADDMQQQASQIRNFYHSLTPEQMAHTAKANIAIQAKDQVVQEKILNMVKVSDPKTVGNIMYELMTSDLRGELGSIDTPILLLGASGGFTTEAEHNFVKALYQQQLDSASSAILVMHKDARHFMMWEAPEWLYQQIHDFL